MVEPPRPKLKPRKQVAALPVMYGSDGILRVMLITSRETKRLIIPKGWPMKGRKDHRAAAIEAREEAGLIGRIHRKSIGSYSYWKRRPEHFIYCVVKVFVLEVLSQLPEWHERGERRGVWLLVDDAAELVDDPGLVTIIRDLPKKIPSRKKRRRDVPGSLDQSWAPPISQHKDLGEAPSAKPEASPHLPIPLQRTGDVTDA